MPEVVERWWLLSYDLRFEDLHDSFFIEYEINNKFIKKEISDFEELRNLRKRLGNRMVLMDVSGETSQGRRDDINFLREISHRP